MERLEGKVAIVTGCGGAEDGIGNGQAIAITLARHGAKVFGIDRDLGAAERTAKIIRAEGGVVEIRQADATQASDVRATVDACIRTWGQIDILVNNVGQSEPGDPVSMSEETWTAQLDLNVTSAFLSCKFVIPLMEQAGGGSIINISSIAGLRYVGKPQVGYAAAKAALMQMTKTTAIIHAKAGVRLNCVAPGLVFTPLVRRLAEKYAGGDYENFVARRHHQVPVGKMGDAWDVANAVLFLASDESKYITAQCITVDGGITESTPV